MRMRRVVAAAGMAVLLGAGSALADMDEGAGDPAAGKRVYNACKACHELTRERNRVGPHLVQIINRPVAAVENFRYSKALRAKGEEGMVWSEENLAQWLRNPRKFIPGNRMAFRGLRKDEDIRNVIAYMREQAGEWEGGE